MGQESTTKQPNLLEITGNLSELQIRLNGLGWVGTNFGFNLGRHEGSLDLIKSQERILIYPTNQEDETSYRLLAETQVPKLELTQRTNQLALVKLPSNTKALDSMRFIDQEVKTGYLGAFEVLDSVAKLLTTIFRRTHHLPIDIKLHKLALIPGSPDIIKLIPPLNLQPAVSCQDVITQLSADLQIQDPGTKHNIQVAYLNKRFQYYLSSPNHD